MSDDSGDVNMAGLANSSDEEPVFEEPNLQEAAAADGEEEEEQEEEPEVPPAQKQGWLPSRHRKTTVNEVLTGKVIFQVRQQASQHQTDAKKAKVHLGVTDAQCQAMMSQVTVAAGFGGVIGGYLGSRHHLSIRGHPIEVEKEIAVANMVGSKDDADLLEAIAQEIQPKWKNGLNEETNRLFPQGVNHSGAMDSTKALKMGLKYELQDFTISEEDGKAIAKYCLKVLKKTTKTLNDCSDIAGVVADKSQVQAAVMLGLLEAWEAFEGGEAEPEPVNNNFNYKKRARVEWDDGDDE